MVSVINHDGSSFLIFRGKESFLESLEHDGITLEITSFDLSNA
jgi:hypothetical protein